MEYPLPLYITGSAASKAEVSIITSGSSATELSAAPHAVSASASDSIMIIFSSLVVEETDSCKCHCDIVLVAGLDNVVVTDRAARLCDILNA